MALSKEQKILFKKKYRDVTIFSTRSVLKKNHASKIFPFSACAFYQENSLSAYFFVNVRN